MSINREGNIMRSKTIKPLVAALVAVSVLVGCGNTASPTVQTSIQEQTQEVKTEIASTVVEESKEEISTAVEVERTLKDDGIAWQQFLADMGVGWNLGNTLDCIDCTWKSNHMDYEAAWIPGDPKTTKEMIQYIKESGFKTIRVPVSWHDHVTATEENGNKSFAIDEEWLARVKEVVDYCYDEGLYVVINIHHDDETNKFIYPTDELKDQSISYITDVWTRVATEFADYDTHLIYEVYNEVRLAKTDDEWNAQSANSKKAQKIMNEYAQAAVDAIRAVDKGYNESRFIFVPGYAASLDSYESYILPNDPGQYANRIGVAVHAYTPYSFCMDTSASGKSKYDQGVMTSAREVFRRIDKYYINKDIPVYVGEWGVVLKSDNAGEREQLARYNVYASQTICKDSEGNIVRIPTMLWDNGFMGNPSENEVFGYFDRKNVKWFDESADFIDALFIGYKDSFEEQN